MIKKRLILETTEVSDSDLLVRLLADARFVFVKKLSKNDRGWAWFPKQNKQDGPYIPEKERDSGFFPPLMKQEGRGAAREIYEVFFETVWPKFSASRRSHLVNYRSKGKETHLTGVPREAFSELSPASFLVMGRIGTGQTPEYRCLTIDSSSDTAALLTSMLGLAADFDVGVLQPAQQQQSVRDELLAFADEVLAAWRRGELATFAAQNASMPDTATLAELAREKYLTKHGIADLDPYRLANPGDVIREISRVTELEIFRERQLRASALALVSMLVKDATESTPIGDLVRRLIAGVREIDAIMLSASQQRRSRAGASFEHHIESLLSAARAPYERQVVIESRRRPDFVLPSFKHLRTPSAGDAPGLILSAKTTLRERWKQVKLEKQDDDLYLATVDENISGAAISDMATHNIFLVVPEALKVGDRGKKAVTEYHGHHNVLSFREWFDDVLAVRRLDWSGVA
jgi:hypothetical protein